MTSLRRTAALSLAPNALVVSDASCRIVACVVDPVGDLEGLCALIEEVGFIVRRFDRGGDLLGGVPSDACCVVCDDRLPDLDGAELLSRLRALRPDLPVVVASRSGSLEAAVSAMRNGAVTVLSRPLSADRLRAAIREAVGVHVARKAKEERRRDIVARFAALTPDESATLDLMMRGVASKAIALKTGVGLRTVERRRAAIYKTLGVDSVVAAALLRAELHGSLYGPSAN